MQFLPVLTCKFSRTLNGYIEASSERKSLRSDVAQGRETGQQQAHVGFGVPNPTKKIDVNKNRRLWITMMIRMHADEEGRIV